MYGAVAVAGFGLALAVGFLWNFLRKLDELSVVAPPVAVLVVGLAVSGAMVYAGGRWFGSMYTIAEARRVAAWSYVGATAALLLVAFTIGISLAEGRTPAEPRMELLFGAAGGALAGLVAGHQNVLAHRQVDRAERARDSMAFLNRTLRHEVLNGVQLVSGHAQNLRDHVGDDAEHSVETIEDASEEVSELIDDVGRVADVHAGNADLVAVDIADVVADEVDRLRRAHPETTIRTDVPDSVEVRGNDAVAHVLRNLLSNAVEHNDGEPTVWVTVDRGTEMVRVDIADDGPGIPDDARAGLFDPTASGTHGFGLHLVRTLVEGYGGEVSVGDNEPRGAVFAVELPRPNTPSEAVFDGGVALGVGTPGRDGVTHRRSDAAPSEELDV
jgi:signal transduction histidine kinase